MRIAAISLFLSSLLAAAIVTSANAVMIPIDQPTLVADSPFIVRGTVAEMTSSWNEARTVIYTNVVVEVDEEFKGRLEKDKVVVTHLGGTVGTTRLEVSDTPDFAVGEDVILFLTPRTEDFAVTYKYQGKYTVIDGMVSEKRESVTTFVSRIQQLIQQQNR